MLQDGDLMAEGNDLSLLSGTGPKCRGDQSQKSDEKWSHRGNDDDLTKGAKTCIFNPDGVFGIHRFTARKLWEKRLIKRLASPVSHRSIINDRHPHSRSHMRMR